jgi:hypothetical protein
MVLTADQLYWRYGCAFRIVTQIATLEFKGCQGVIW